MFKLPSRPSANALSHELADFAELLCWEQGKISSRELVAYLGRVDDNDYDNGCESDEDENTDLADEVFRELELRQVSCAGGYPFKIEMSGNVLVADYVKDNRQHNVYRYLLLSTRMNMKDNKIHAGIDGTKLLEFLAADVLRSYLGNQCKSFVFGLL